MYLLHKPVDDCNYSTKLHIRVCALPSCTQAKTKILSVNNISVPLCPCESLKYKLQNQDTIYLDLTAL